MPKCDFSARQGTPGVVEIITNPSLQLESLYRLNLTNHTGYEDGFFLQNNNKKNDDPRQTECDLTRQQPRFKRMADDNIHVTVVYSGCGVRAADAEVAGSNPGPGGYTSMEGKSWSAVR